jgi:hypothetical protein
MPNNLRRPVLGYVTGFTSAAIFGFNGSVMSVLLMHDTLSAAQVTLLRSFVAMVLTGLVLLFIDRSAFKISKRQLGLVVKNIRSTWCTDEKKSRESQRKCQNVPTLKAS